MPKNFTIPDFTGTLPDTFSWGIATSALQIEGGAALEGRGRSNWDTFALEPGRIVDGSVPDVTTDHFHRYQDDVALMSQLGVDAYRFSIAWPRIMPDGSTINPAGFDFYDRLLDSLLDKGIRPFATLFHWDLPQTLESNDGWVNRDTAALFADYCATVSDRLGDRIEWWSTINEPFEASMRAYAQGLHAPGRHDRGAALASAHHLMLGHALGTERIRATRPDAQLGIVVNLYPIEAHTESKEDRDLARRMDLIQNRIFLDPLLTGSYSLDALELFNANGVADVVRDGDTRSIGAPMDFIGVNYYTTYVVSAAGEPDIQAGAYVGAEDVAFIDPTEKTDMGLAVRPDGLRTMLNRISSEYTCPPIYITENGSAYLDTITADGQVNDTARARFLTRHIGAICEAFADGVDIRGYFPWTLVDNFEWSNGFSQRFGMVHLDRETLKRTPKQSFHTYQQIIAAHSSQRPSLSLPE